MAPLSSKKVILVTGANRSLGLCMLHSLAIHPQLRDSEFLLGCRDLQKGRDAIDELRRQNVQASIQPLELDITSDSSIRGAVEFVTTTFGRLDVLVNNAAQVWPGTAPDMSDARSMFNKTLDANVTSMYMVTALFLPLLRQTPGNPKVMAVTSNRASFADVLEGKQPPIRAYQYGAGKAALNNVQVGFSLDEANANVEFQLVSPSFCSTAFNGFAGPRDPMEGAQVVVQLATSERRPIRIWETEGDTGKLIEIGW